MASNTLPLEFSHTVPTSILLHFMDTDHYSLGIQYVIFNRFLTTSTNILHSMFLKCWSSKVLCENIQIITLYTLPYNHKKPLFLQLSDPMLTNFNVTIVASNSAVIGKINSLNLQDHWFLYLETKHEVHDVLSITYSSTKLAFGNTQHHKVLLLGLFHYKSSSKCHNSASNTLLHTRIFGSQIQMLPQSQTHNPGCHSIYDWVE